MVLSSLDGIGDLCHTQHGAVQDPLTTERLNAATKDNNHGIHQLHEHASSDHDSSLFRGQDQQRHCSGAYNPCKASDAYMDKKYNYSTNLSKYALVLYSCRFFLFP